MADKPAKEEEHKTHKADKSVVKHRGQRLSGKQVIDIKPAGTAPAAATSRPVVTGTAPKHADTTLSRHGATITPVQTEPAAAPAAGKPIEPSAPVKPATIAAPPAPQAAAPAPALSPAPAAPAAPAPVAVTPPVVPASAATAPAPTPTPTPATPAPAPATPAAATPAQPAAPAATPVAAPKPPVPEVAAPNAMMPDHELDELELANLTGVHGIVDKNATPQTATPGAALAPAPLPKKEMHQTPEQARKLAAALRDLKHNPVAPPSDKPIVVVHRHDYLRNLAVFFGFLIGGALFALVILDLALDADLLDLSIQPLTNFF